MSKRKTKQPSRISRIFTTKKQSGYRWRLLAHRKDGSDLIISNDGRFDELCLDTWFHLEEMDQGEWRMQVGDACVYVTVPKDGRDPVVFIERGYYCTCIKPCTL